MPLLAQAVEQQRRDARAAHDAGPTDAELGHAALGSQLSAKAVEHATADRTGLLEIGFGDGEGDVVAAALVGGLNDQVHVDGGRGQRFEQTGRDAGRSGMWESAITAC